MSSGYVKGLAAAWFAVAVAGAVGAEFQAITGGIPVWPATGVAAGIALARPRTTPAIAVALLTARFGNGTPWGVATAWGVLTAIAIVLLVLSLRRIEGEQKRHTGLWFAGLAVVTAVTSATLASSIGSAIQFVAESQSTTFTLHWMTGDLLSLLVLVPMVRALLERRRPRIEAWTGPESRRSPDVAAPFPPIARVHPVAAKPPADTASADAASADAASADAASADTASADAASADAASVDTSRSAVAEHPVLSGAAYFVWDRAAGRVLAQGNALRQTLHGSLNDNGPGDPEPLENVTVVCTDWLREAGPETRRAIRSAFIRLRRDRTPVDLRLPLTAPTAARQDATPYGPTLRLRAWASYRPNGRLTRVQGVVEDLRAGMQAERARAERITTLEREVDWLQSRLSTRAGQDRQIAELLLLLRRTLADADSLIGEFDRATESSLAEGLADRTFDVAAAIRKALRVTTKLATQDGDRPRRANGPTASNEESPASPPRSVGSEAAPRWSRRAISVASLLEEDDA